MEDTGTIHHTRRKDRSRLRDLRPLSARIIAFLQVDGLHNAHGDHPGGHVQQVEDTCGDHVARRMPHLLHMQRGHGGGGAQQHVELRQGPGLVEAIAQAIASKVKVKNKPRSSPHSVYLLVNT